MSFLLEIKNLKTQFYTEDGIVPAVDGVSFNVKPGEVVAVVGESGSGKSVTALSVLRLIPDPPGKIIDGEILFEGKDLIKYSENEMRKIRGNDIAMIFQEPMTSLNPVFTIGYQIMEAIKFHQNLDAQQAREKCIEMLNLVGIPRAEKMVDEYPHQFSGGMRQRAMIAMALSCNPKLLIADEPTTALDVTIQAQIIELLLEIRDKLNTAIILITHDLGVVAEMADYVVVMHDGIVMEEAPCVDLFNEPKHPYTLGLMRCRPDLQNPRRRLDVVPDYVNHPIDPVKNNLYIPDGIEGMEPCKVPHLDLIELEGNRKVRCWKCEYYLRKGGGLR